MKKSKIWVKFRKPQTFSKAVDRGRLGSMQAHKEVSGFSIHLFLKIVR